MRTRTIVASSASAVLAVVFTLIYAVSFGKPVGISPEDMVGWSEVAGAVVLLGSMWALGFYSGKE